MSHWVSKKNAIERIQFKYKMCNQKLTLDTLDNELAKLQKRPCTEDNLTSDDVIFGCDDGYRVCTYEYFLEGL